MRRFGYVRNSLDNDTARQPSGAARVEDEDGHRRNPTHLEAVLREIEMMKSLDHPTLLKLDEYFLGERTAASRSGVSRLHRWSHAEAASADR